MQTIKSYLRPLLANFTIKIYNGFRVNHTIRQTNRQTLILKKMLFSSVQFFCSKYQPKTYNCSLNRIYLLLQFRSRIPPKMIFQDINCRFSFSDDIASKQQSSTLFLASSYDLKQEILVPMKIHALHFSNKKVSPLCMLFILVITIAEIR